MARSEAKIQGNGGWCPHEFSMCLFSSWSSSLCWCGWPPTSKYQPNTCAIPDPSERMQCPSTPYKGSRSRTLRYPDGSPETWHFMVKSMPVSWLSSYSPQHPAAVAGLPWNGFRFKIKDNWTWIPILLERQWNRTTLYIHDSFLSQTNVTKIKCQIKCQIKCMTVNLVPLCLMIGAWMGPRITEAKGQGGRLAAQWLGTRHPLPMLSIALSAQNFPLLLSFKFLPL